MSRNDGLEESAADEVFFLAYNPRADGPAGGSPVREYPSMFRSAFAAAATVAVALTMVLAPADAQPRRIQLGTLTCAMSSSIGLIIGSQKNVNSVFRGQAGEPDEAYTGTMTTVGLDIGITTGGVIVWTVFADTNRYAGMLAGRYTGATAEVSVAAPAMRAVATRRSGLSRRPARWRPPQRKRCEP